MKFLDNKIDLSLILEKFDKNKTGLTQINSKNFYPKSFYLNAK
jgi:hypothetical protein